MSSSVVHEVAKRPVRAKPMRNDPLKAAIVNGPNDPDAPEAPNGSTASAGTAGQVSPARRQQGLANAQQRLKEDFCTEVLVHGYVQSFVDLFYLTHRQEVQFLQDPKQAASGSPTNNRNATNGNGSASNNGNSPPSLSHGNDKASAMDSPAKMQLAEMEFLRDQLIAAEHCKRKGSIADVLAAYDSLATYCMEKNDMKTMIFFFEKCLELCRLTKDQMSELRVLNQIGIGYHSLGDLDKAKEYQEYHVALAREVYAPEESSANDAEASGFGTIDGMVPGGLEEAYLQLGKVHFDIANQAEIQKDLVGAIASYKKYFELQICKNTSDVEGEGNACAELAITHENLNNKQLSIDYLNQYLQLATKSDNIETQADACRRLGQIYTELHEFTRAREMMERNYELMTSNSNMKTLNASRINAGVARMNDKIKVHLSLLNDDLHGLLEWKSTRAIPSSE